MIKRIRGRMTASLLLCFVILFASLGFGATYAWFTAVASNEPSLFIPGAGIVSGSGQQCVELDLNCYNFAAQSVSRQESLKSAVDDILSVYGLVGNETQALLNGAFLAWWQSDGIMDASFFEKTEYPAIGQVFVKQYSYVNDTGIPLYIRMKPELSGFDAAVLGWVGADASAWSFDPSADFVLAYGGPDGEGYFYLEEPLNPGEEIVIAFAFYSLAAGSQDGAELAANLTLDAIQALNNAPYMEPNWKKPYDDGYVNYIPYTP